MPISEETRRKLSESHMGKPGYWAGKKRPDNHYWLGKKRPNLFSDEARKKLGSYHIAEKNVNWKGDKVGRDALHDWIKSRLGFPNKCEHCGFESTDHYKIHWANKSGKYKRVLTDWMRLCLPCHRKYDNWSAKMWATRRKNKL